MTSFRAPRASPAWRQLIQRATVHEVLMGAQDNLTNVLAVVLGVTIGAGRADFIALAGLSAGIAESVSMGGVLYNATRAEQRLSKRSRDVGDAPPENGTPLSPVLSGVVTFFASLIAGLVPLAPFAVLPVSTAVVASMGMSVVGLFVLGSLTGQLGGESWLREGARLVLVAGIAALAAALVGAALHVS